MCRPAVVESWMLLTVKRDLTVYELLCRGCPWDRVVPNRVWNLPGTVLDVLLIWLVGWTSLWSNAHQRLCLFWVHLGRAPLQVDVRCCLSYLSGATTQFAVCGCLFWAWVCVEGAKLCTKVGFLQLWAGVRPVQGLRHPKVNIHLSATLPPSEVAQSSLRDFRRKYVLWVLASCHPQTLPQGASLIGQGDWSCGDRASGSPAWGQHSQALNGGKMASTPSHTTQSLTLAPLRGAHHRFTKGCSQPAPCRSKLGWVEPPGVRRTGQMSLLLGEWCQLSLQGVGVRMAPCTIPAQPSTHLES